MQMVGKAGRWLRSFFVTAGSWRGRKQAKDGRGRQQTDADTQSVASASAAALPTPAREKRRWSFRRPSAPAAVVSKVDAAAGDGEGPLAPSSSQGFSEAEVRVVVVAGDQPAAAVPEVDATVVPRPPLASETEREGSGARGGDGQEAAAAAAIRIQSAFRAYLARKALCALRGMVKLQAMVRGQLVRRQANATLRRMQALVDAQMRARAERMRLLVLEDDGVGGGQLASETPRQHPRGKLVEQATERSSEENAKIVEMDDGGAPRHPALPRRGGDGSEPFQKVSPTPSALTDANSVGTLSGRFDDSPARFTACSAPQEPQSRRRGSWPRADHAHAPPFPGYMANTESSRAKARSQSAPRQRCLAAAASESSAAASPSPSCGERPPSCGARRRASLDPLDLLGARAAAQWSSLGRVERCASRARARAAGASLPGSECGSSAWRD